MQSFDLSALSFLFPRVMLCCWNEWRGKGHSGGRACGGEVRSPSPEAFLGAWQRLATVHFCRLCSTCPPPLHTDVNLLAGLLEQGWGTDEHFTAIFLSASSELWAWKSKMHFWVKSSRLPNFCFSCCSSQGPSSLESGALNSHQLGIYFFLTVTNLQDEYI